VKTRAEITRAFWAQFLDAKIEKDGQIKGWRRWWDAQDDNTRAFADRVERDLRFDIVRGMNQDDAITDAVVKLQDFVRDYRPPENERSRVEYAEYRFGLIQSIFKHRWNPSQVADILAAAMKDFPEITQAEIDSYRSMGDRWRPENGQFDPDWWERDGSPDAKQRVALERSREKAGLPEGLGPKSGGVGADSTTASTLREKA